MQKELFDLKTVCFDHKSQELIILDQTLLPGETKYLRLKHKEEIHDAIYRLCVRGAPAIGVAAAYGIYLAGCNFKTTDTEKFLAEFKKAKEYLASSRPTAVNLFWALDRMEGCLFKNKNLPVGEILNALLKEADEIFEEDVRVCAAIGEVGLSLLKPGMGLLTHCNAGALAASRYGTALAPIYFGHERGYEFKVYADETRPLLQGARLTAYELRRAGVDVTLICDNMASSVMKNGWVQGVLVGCDRLAANGDAANKIGTSGLAILAKHYNVPFYVCLPTSTIDLNCASGADINIEERSSLEITHQWYEKPMSAEGVKVYNPAFDVTDASLITAIITERGIIRPPYDMAKALGEQVHI